MNFRKRIPVESLRSQRWFASADMRGFSHRQRAQPYERSDAALYRQHVSQAPDGCDFDFLSGDTPVPDPPIY